MKKSAAVVTGASHGIGRATAIRLACDFSTIVLAARNQAAALRDTVWCRPTLVEGLILLFSSPLSLSEDADTQTVGPARKEIVE